jgi:hypothetical protein
MYRSAGSSALPNVDVLAKLSGVMPEEWDRRAAARPLLPREIVWEGRAGRDAWGGGLETYSAFDQK